MPLRRRLNSRAFPVLLFSSILLCCFPGSIMSAMVTVNSIEIFNTHAWLPSKPTVYFQCKGENKTYLPDVKKTHVSYTFKGEESWQHRCASLQKGLHLSPWAQQDFAPFALDNYVTTSSCQFKFGKPKGPLTSNFTLEDFKDFSHTSTDFSFGNPNDSVAFLSSPVKKICQLLFADFDTMFSKPLMEFPNTKCKRCGFYEEDILKSDEFDEWEFCPSDFTNPDGSYNKFKVKEFNATFLCPDCVPLGCDSNHASGAHNGGKGMDLAIAHNGGKEMHLAVVILISALVSTVFTLVLVASYMYWQKRKREQGKARFRKTF
ncbi:hypothetical protein RHMOL_Rhmol04G0252800 [Rhododendron molle]|uniref:Uncharacterized protein n=1 Tax=Rhododendron molle TaxID=49168 RepID=A0ACC0P477_RHOML|nr:hypothetical protein RHMOL_Rhmol04G0252800 [Rhododendron molle]